MAPASPVEKLWTLINTHVIARCIHVIADAGVADALGDHPASADELAASTGMNADALGRMLRLLSAHGVFAWQAHGYVHTEASRLLRSDHPQSLRSFARMIGMPVIWRGFTDLEHVGRTGKPAIGYADLVTYFADHPHKASLFDEAMACKSAAVVPTVLDAYDFSSFQVIADIGGGRGHLLKAILARAPDASGVLFDLPHVIAAAPAIAATHLKVMQGDFFRDALPVADCYVLMEVLHDWGEHEAASILAAIRRVAPTSARLLIIEAVISESPEPHFAKMLDIIMLAVTGGRERTRSDYERLLASTGFRLERLVPTASQYSILEAAVM